MSDKEPPAPGPTDAAESPGLETRFPELAEIQREIALRIRDNKRFLERLMDDARADEDDEDPDEDGEVFEEL
jgi:hypothetical protein